MSFENFSNTQLSETVGPDNTALEQELAERFDMALFYLTIALSQCEATSENQNVYDDDTGHSVSVQCLRDFII